MSEINFFFKKVIALGRSPWCENQADMEAGDRSAPNSLPAGSVLNGMRTREE